MTEKKIVILEIMIEMYYNNISSIVNDGIGEVLYLLKKISQSQRAQKVTLFNNVFIRTKSIKR